MRSILVPVEKCDSLKAQLSAALLIAERCNGHLDGIAPSLAMEPYMSDGLPIRLSADVFDSFQQQHATEMKKAARSFRSFMNKNKVAWKDPATPSHQVTAGWLDEREGGDNAIGQVARLYDLTVLARTVPGHPIPRADLLETVLFESGRAILVVPPKVPARIGEVVLVAWDGSIESARALLAARPILQRAERVIVLSFDSGTVEGPSVEEAVNSLLRMSVRAEAHRVDPEGHSIGESVLEEAGNLGADLLIKGAYTHSRLRHLIFGGATKHILTEATLPVLMVH